MVVVAKMELKYVSAQVPRALSVSLVAAWSDKELQKSFKCVYCELYSALYYILIYSEN